jgi:hypothetical protein
MITYVTVPVGPKIVVINHCDSVSDEELIKAVAAFARQVNEHFAQPPPFGYGIGARFRIGAAPLPDEWALVLHKGAPDIEGAAAYHDLTETGCPVMHIFPDADKADGQVWTVSASHEILETLVDPNVCTAVQAPDGRFRPKEVADPVEALSYTIDGVAVTNWVRPLYFEPAGARTDDLANLDYMGRVTRAFEVLPGGYEQVWDPVSGGWIENYNAGATPRTYRITRKRVGLGRRARRSRHGTIPK